MGAADRSLPHLLRVHFRGRRYGDAGGDGGILGFGFAVGAEVFHDPLEAGDRLGNGLFQQLLLGENPFGAAGDPVVPDKGLRL